MSGPKKWVSSKVHRKGSSKSNLNSSFNHNASSPTRAPASPPTRLHDDTLSATAIVDFGSGSTFMTQRCDGAHVVGGGHSTTYSGNSSLESFGTGLTHSPLTQSPSTTPPKKTWEKNYRSFLRKTGIHSMHSKAPALNNTRAATGQQY